MEKYLLICYRDRKAGVFGVPKVELNEQIAVRTFLNACKKSDNQDFALDLELFKVGEYDCLTGVIKAYDSPIYICGYTGE